MFERLEVIVLWFVQAEWGEGSLPFYVLFLPRWHLWNAHDPITVARSYSYFGDSAGFKHSLAAGLVSSLLGV